MPRFSFADLTTRPPTRRAGAALLLLLAGAACGAGAVGLTRPSVSMAPTTPIPVAQLSARSGIVSVHGQVTERFGNRFLLQDPSGHVLVDAGPDARREAIGAPITVQGRFDRGELYARFLVDASDHVEEVAPPPPPPGVGPGAPPPPPGVALGAPPPPPGMGPVAPPPIPGGSVITLPVPGAALPAPPAAAPALPAASPAASPAAAAPDGR